MPVHFRSGVVVSSIRACMHRLERTVKVGIQNQRFVRGAGQVVSADEYTSLAFWYQEEPHRDMRMQPYLERTGETKAIGYKVER